MVRTKYTVYNEDSAALAAAVDVRLPTGRQQDLLGTGSASYKFSAIGSIEGSRKRGYQRKADLPEVAVLEITGQEADGELLARPQKWRYGEPSARL